MLDTLILDRTAADVTQWAELRQKGWAAMSGDERAQWAAGLKGAYNAEDLNRVTAAMEYLMDLYEKNAYSVDYVPLVIEHADGSADTVWQKTDIPTEDQMARLLANLHAFWVAVEAVGAKIDDVWGEAGFGYVNPDAQISVGEYSILTEAHGLTSITATVTSPTIDVISAVGPGWEISRTSNSITAVLTTPNGFYEDIQQALNSLLILSADRSSYADATVSLRADLRSGATKELGSGSIRWSSVISWLAFSAYNMTWAKAEADGLTWDAWEHLPILTGGDGA